MKSLAASLALVLLVVTGTLGLVGHLAFTTPHPPARGLVLEATTEFAAGVLPAAPPVVPARPTVTPTPAVQLQPASLPPVTPAPTPARADGERFEAWSAPASLPTATMIPRGACDPAYPEERTCIPPGPPFDQGCAITEQRLFDVLPPDPQRLDSDNDGIGCEPI